MFACRRSDCAKVRKWLREIEGTKQTAEISLAEIAKMLRRVGFVGPEMKSGAARGFQHELLKREKCLMEGKITVHATSSKQGTVHFANLKKYILPHVESVLEIIEKEGLYESDDAPQV